MKKRKRIVLDTDIGIDCDDAVALGAVLGRAREGKCELLAVTCSTMREGAPETAKAVCDYYGINVPIGRTELPPLACDFDNNYARAVAEKYGAKTPEIGAVGLIRKTLAEADEKIVLVAIGPLCNMAELLRSGADEYSDMSGEALVTEKVSEIYVMGGAFRPKADGKPTAEWNILQDVGSARYFAANCPVPIVFSPHELGARVFTYPEDMPEPVRYSMTSFAEAAGESVDGFKRESWDPVTCLAAIDGEKYGLKIGENGVVSIDEEGVTSFVPDKNGKHRILRLVGGAEKLERAIALAAGK